MTRKATLSGICFVLLLLVLAPGQGNAETRVKKEKLQVFILAGQSNMVGHSYYITIPTLLTAKEPEVRDLAKLVFKKDAKISRAVVEDLIATRIKRDNINKDLRAKKIEGADKIAAAQAEVKKLQAQVDAKMEKIKDTFVVSKQVYITSIADGNRGSGPLTVGYGGNRDKIGPEFGFGLTMAQKMDAPILIIKTSWGGKSLNYNFRPPSAGPYKLNEKEQTAKNAADISKNASLNWRMMNEAVHNVLKDLKTHHPAYDAKVGYDIAGFVWFQGWNDMYGGAELEYASNMKHLINDVRKDLKAPKLPFVIGVMGAGGPIAKYGPEQKRYAGIHGEFRKAMAAPAKLPEFKGNVTAVFTENYWDLQLSELVNRNGKVNAKRRELSKDQTLTREQRDKAVANYTAKLFTKRELKILQTGTSNAAYHYLGSAKILAQIGKAFANALAAME